MTPFTRKARRWATRTLLAAGALAVAACTAPGPGVGTGPRINTAKPVTVALLLPRGSGQAGDEVLAASLENAARLAIADLEGARIDLRVYATAANPAVAAQVARQAAGDGAKIILGPVYASAANAAGTAVAARNLNVLAFSNNTDIAGGNVFVLGNTFENTADRLVRYAVANGRRNIMVVNGQDAAEEKGRAAIAAAIARHGAVPAGSAAFELSQNGVVQAAPGIVRAARANDAQAIFMTSGTAGALPILSQLLVDNGLGSETTQFVGLQRWDIPASALELPSLQGGWFAMPDPWPGQQFQARYAAAYGQAPHPIAGLAYDGIAAIGALVGSGRSSALTTQALTQATGFAGVGGAFRLRPDGTNERAIAIATIVEQQVTILDPAPTSFGGAGL